MNTTTATRATKRASHAARFTYALLATTALLLSITVNAQSNTNQNTGITVTGAGAAYGEPDRALVTLGVEAVADNVRDAMADADAAMNQVRQAVINLGLEQRQLRTVSFNVWRQQLTDQAGQPTGERYHVQHLFQITVDDTTLVGQLLADAIDAGANNVGGISFTIADTAQLQSRAREAAMADAHARASQLAELAGVTLGSVTTVEETSYNAPQVAAGVQYARMAASPVESGELAVNVTVRVVYAIQQAAD
ncbi:MAG: SIMPL domain-containing protein [Trueperaceae bacterium]